MHAPGSGHVCGERRFPPSLCEPGDHVCDAAGAPDAGRRLHCRPGPPNKPLTAELTARHGSCTDPYMEGSQTGRQGSNRPTEQRRAVFEQDATRIDLLIY